MKNNIPIPQFGIWTATFITLLALGLILLALLMFSPEWFLIRDAWLPVPLHSLLRADYSADPRGSFIPAAQIDLIDQVIKDQVRPTGELPSQMAPLSSLLLTPVATITPQFFELTQTLGAPATPVNQVTATQPPAQPSPTLLAATATLQSSATSTQANTATSTQPAATPTRPQPTRARATAVPTEPPPEPTQAPTARPPEPTEPPPAPTEAPPPATKEPYPPPPPPPSGGTPYP